MSRWLVTSYLNPKIPESVVRTDRNIIAWVRNLKKETCRLPDTGISGFNRMNNTFTIIWI